MPYVGLDGDVQIKIGAGAYAACDRVISGEQTPGGGIEHAAGIGGQDDVIGQMLEPMTTLETFVQSTLPALAKRSAINGLPQSFGAIDLGVPGVVMSSQEECYLNSVKLSCEKGGALKASYEFLGLSHTASALATSATKKAKGLIYEWFAATVLLGGSAYKSNSFESSLENGLKLHTSMDAGTSGSLRQPEAITPGDQKVTLRAEFQAPVNLGITDDRPATFAFVAKFANSSGDVRTHTVTNLHPTSQPQKVATGEDDITWEVELEADLNDLNAWAFA